MIPKVIHYCWFGSNPLPQLTKKCIESWKKYCPDYEIKEWNDSNFDMGFCDFAIEAYKAKKWAFLSDCARLKVIYEEGGIYLDTDVELVKPLDALLENPAFLGEETTGYINTGHGFGAEKRNPVIAELLKQYKGHFEVAKNIYDTMPCPRKNTAPLNKMGYSFSGKTLWRNDNVVVYPPEYFCPINYETGELVITENTFSIHHYSALWITEDEKDLNRRITEMEKCNNRIFSFFKRFWMRYVFYKEKGEADSILQYVIEKIRKKIVAHCKTKLRCRFY